MLSNFYVMGVPRSGTSYLVKLLNSHESVFCGFEFIPAHEFTSDSLRIENITKYIESTEKAKRAKIIIRRKRNLIFVGDKMPRSFYVFDRIERNIGGGPIFIMFRQPRDVFASWDVRANDASDVQWPAGMNWFVAYIDMIFLLTKIQSSVDESKVLIGYKYMTDLETREQFAFDLFKYFGLNLTSSVRKFLTGTERRARLSICKLRNRKEEFDIICDMDHMKEYEGFIEGLDLGTYDGGIKNSINNILSKFALDIKYNEEKYDRLIFLNSRNKDFKEFMKSELRKMQKNTRDPHLLHLLGMVQTHTSPFRSFLTNLVKG